MRVDASASTLDRTASALTAFRALSRDFADAAKRSDAATALVESHALTEPEGAGLDALAHVVAAQGERREAFARA